MGPDPNAYVENKVFIIVEEFYMQGRGEILDDLKPLITNQKMKVESKGVDQRMMQNLSNWAFFTNHMDAVLKSRNDRRYAVFFTAQQPAADLGRDGKSGKYFPDLIKWLQTRYPKSLTQLATDIVPRKLPAPTSP